MVTIVYEFLPASGIPSAVECRCETAREAVRQLCREGLHFRPGCGAFTDSVELEHCEDGALDVSALFDVLDDLADLSVSGLGRWERVDLDADGREVCRVSAEVWA